MTTNPPLIHKTCTKCGEAKPLSCFYSPGAVCKGCKAIDQRARRAAGGEAYKAKANEKSKKYYNENAAARVAYRKEYISRNKAQEAERNKKYRAANRERLNELSRQKRQRMSSLDRRVETYKVSLSFLHALWAVQQGRCGVCRVELPDPAVVRGNGACLDHCHDTGRVRGWLCKLCNTFEGRERRLGDALRAYRNAPPASAALDVEGVA